MNWRSVIAAAPLIWLIAAGGASAASARVQSVALESLGFRDDLTATGVYPSFTFNVPRYPTMESATLALTLHISPLADPKSSIEVLVNGAPVYSRFVREIGRDPHLSVPLPLPPGSTANMAITVRGYLFITGDICSDSQARGLYLTLERRSAIVIHTTGESRSVAGFFHDYGGTISVVTASASLDSPSREIVALPYRLRQIESWHQPEIKLANAPLAGGRSIIIRAGSRKLDRALDRLYVDPAAIGALRSATVEALVGSSIASLSIRPEAIERPRTSRLSLAELGQHPQTASGVGDLAFDFPLYASALGGVPRDLQFHVGLTHSPLLANSSGLMEVFLNGRLIGSHEIAKNRTQEDLEVAIPRAALSTVNGMRVVVSSYYGSNGCTGSIARMTASLLDSSYFSWSGVDSHVDTIADFMKLASGRVAVLLDDPVFYRAAFRFLGELGTLNGRIRELNVDRFTGTIPSGYDFVLIFARPQALGNLDLPVHAQAATFRIINPLDQREIFSADEGRPFATIQVVQVANTPALVFSYYRDPSAIAKLEGLSANDAINQNGNAAFLSDSLVSFSIGTKIRVDYETPSPVAALWNAARLPLSLTLVALIVIGLFYASRRLASASAT